MSPADNIRQLPKTWENAYHERPIINERLGLQIVKLIFRGNLPENLLENLSGNLPGKTLERGKLNIL